jgi:hypothetical protein
MAKGLARSIKTRRDYRGATAVAGKLRDKSGRESEEERRLQALLQEIEKFDPVDEAEDDSVDPADGLDDFPRRRWSDED